MTRWEFFDGAIKSINPLLKIGFAKNAKTKNTLQTHEYFFTTRKELTKHKNKITFNEKTAERLNFQQSTYFSYPKNILCKECNSLLET